MVGPFTTSDPLQRILIHAVATVGETLDEKTRTTILGHAVAIVDSVPHPQEQTAEQVAGTVVQVAEILGGFVHGDSEDLSGTVEELRAQIHRAAAGEGLHVRWELTAPQIDQTISIETSQPASEDNKTEYADRVWIRVNGSSTFMDATAARIMAHHLLTLTGGDPSHPEGGGYM